MTHPTEILTRAGISNPSVHEFVDGWARILEPDRIEVVDAGADERLLAEALEAGEIIEAGHGRYLAHSHPKDTARSEERTVVATHDSADRGVYNNWRDADEVRAQQIERMAGAMAGRTMYVVPYLMAPPGSPLARWAVGVQLSDNRVVVLQMLRMARVGATHLNDLKDPGFFVRAVHATGDLDALGQGTDSDERLFATIADDRTILHFGSAYGGNALLGKIAHGLRQGSYDGWASGRFMGEQFMLIGIRDRATNRTYHICGGMPSASGKTNLAMMLPPAALGERYEVEFYGDDIVWLRVDERDGRVYGMNPEYGTFGVAKDTNWESNPNAMRAVAEGTGTIFVNVAHHETTKELWWEGKTPDYPQDVTGWRDWRNELVSDRPADHQRSGADTDLWSQKNSRFTARLSVVPNIADDYERPEGVPIDAIIFGGRRENTIPLVAQSRNWQHGVFMGATCSSETTAAAKGAVGVLRRDPMAMLPFIGYHVGDYLRHWIRLGERTTPDKLPKIFYVNWFRRDAEGRFLWPGFGENCRVLKWIVERLEGKVEAVETPAGLLPEKKDIDVEGLGISDEHLEQVLRYVPQEWADELPRMRRWLRSLGLKVPQEVHDELWHIAMNVIGDR